MKHEIEELTHPFIHEDQAWSLGVLKSWLIYQKSIPEDLADYAIQKGLLELDEGLKISTHHGYDGFDNHVLRIAQNHIAEVNVISTNVLRNKLETSVKASVGDLESIFTQRLLELEEKMGGMHLDLNTAIATKVKETEEAGDRKIKELNQKLEEEVSTVTAKYKEKLATLDNTLTAYQKGGKISRAWKTMMGKL